MTLAAWKRLEVGTAVEVAVGDTEPFAGKVRSNTRTFLRVIGEHEIRRYRWPPTLARVLDDTSRLQWFDDDWIKCTLTIRKEAES